MGKYFNNILNICYKGSANSICISPRFTNEMMVISTIPTGALSGQITLIGINQTIYSDIKIEILTTIEKAQIDNSMIKLFPNPFESYFKILNQSIKEINYEIFDIIGKSISKGILIQGENEIKIYQKGVYLFKLND